MPLPRVQDLRSVSLTRRFIALSLPLLIIVNLVFYWLYDNQKKNQLSTLGNRAEAILAGQKKTIEKFSDNIFSDLNIILNQHELLDFINDGKKIPSKHLLHDLIQFAKFKKIYDQIRYIDYSGMEIIRINFNNGHPESVTRERLQNKKDRYYFKDTIKLNQNEIFMSPMDLNIEKGEIEIPLKPMIRIGIPVFDKKNEKKGIIVVNYLSRKLLNSLSKTIVSPNEQLVLLNRDGYFLKGIAPSEEWGFMYPGKKHNTFETKFPGIWEAMKKADKGAVVNDTGIFAFDTIFPLKAGIISSDGAISAFSSSKKIILRKEYQWKLVHYMVADDFQTTLKNFKNNVIYLSGFVSLIILAITWFLSLFFHKKKRAEIELRFAYEDLEHKVNERVKELNCLYNMSQLAADQDLSVKAILAGAIEIIPLGFNFSENLQCKISFDQIIVQTEAFTNGFYVLGAPLVISRKNRGTLEVNYSENQEDIDEGPFQKEERALIDSLAKQLSSMISKKENLQEKEKLEEQLLHSQKMEAIGQLAGGIAHDFNNILTVISGFAELGKLSENVDSTSGENFEEIIVAAHKASKLTRQLLVFSRKDEIQPQPTQINTAIKNTIKLLKRIVGEQIAQKVNLDTGISKIIADPSQIDQLLFNLVINARDAIGEKKASTNNTITITTKELYLDKEFAESHLGIEKGFYILLEVTDTGVGMTKELQKKIFTPFFSTKSKKKGTGLGLSTVYGIVRQNKGTISVYSEKDMGTTFKVYWPALKEEETIPVIEKQTPVAMELDHAVVLVVEDDPRLNQFARNALKIKQIEILHAFDGERAIELLNTSQKKVDLLFTDVVLPGMNGRELANTALKINPDIKVLYTSGYTESFFSNDGILPADICFLKKPYSIQNLYEKVGAALQGE